MKNLLFKRECYEIIGACMNVHRELGHGFLEEVYQQALEHELGLMCIPFEREVPLNIKYRNIILNKNYCADFICYDRVIIELKAVDGLNGIHEGQVINYLKATGYQLGLLINFGTKSLSYKRLVLSSELAKISE